MYELAAATVEYGRQVGARVLEGYPTEPTPGKTVIWDEASVGLLQVFIDAGYEVEASPTLRRRVADTDSAQRPDARFCPNRHLLEAAGGTVKAMIATEIRPSDPALARPLRRAIVAGVWGPGHLNVDALPASAGGRGFRRELDEALMP